MKNLLTLGFFTCLLVFSVVGQETEPNVPNFNCFSSLEQELFEKNTDQREATPIALLMAIDSAKTSLDVAAVSRELEAAYRELEAKKIASKPLQRQVKLIFELFHERFLKRYKFIAAFPEVFDSGTYNCVSATALYALAFDHFGIAYRIVEQPSHVYLIADPNNLSIRVETTDPIAGYSILSDRFKKTYVESLVNYKMIEEKEVEERSVATVFNEFYYERVDDLGYSELAAFQYSNYGLELMGEENYPLAVDCFKKFSLLFPASERGKLLIVAATASQLGDSEYSKLDDIRLLIEMFNTADELASPEEIAREFKSLQHKYLIKQGDSAYIGQVYALFLKDLNDSLALNEIMFSYNFERGRILMNDLQYAMSIPFLSKAHALQPNNLDAKSFFARALFLDLSRYENNNPVMLEKLTSYSVQYPQLAQSNIFQSATAMVYLIAARNAFNADLRKEGNSHLQLFESIYDAEKSNVEIIMIAAAYGAAWQSYVRAGQKEKGIKMAKKGLEFAPYNTDLIRYSKY